MAQPVVSNRTFVTPIACNKNLDGATCILKMQCFKGSRRTDIFKKLIDSIHSFADLLS